MDQDKDEKIKARAHDIWVSEGRPHGRHDEHWHRARQEIDGETSDQGPPHPGMFGDGTEEQNLNQAGDPKARITEDEVAEAFRPVKASVKDKP